MPRGESGAAAREGGDAVARFRSRPGLATAALIFAMAASPGLRAQNGDRLVCASGIREDGPVAVLIHVTLVVPEGADEQRLGSEALAQLGARQLPTGQRSPMFVLTGHRWPQFVDGASGERVVAQHYNPGGATVSGDAHASLTAAARAWSDVPTSSFALALREDTMALGGYDLVNVIDWAPASTFPDGVLAMTMLTYDQTTGDIVDADVLVNPGHPLSLNPQPGDGTWDFQRVILHENGHVAGLAHSAVPGSVMYATLPSGPWSHELTPDDVDALSAVYPRLIKAESPPQTGLQPRRR